MDSFEPSLLLAELIPGISTLVLGLILGSFLNVVIYRLPFQLGYKEYLPNASPIAGSCVTILLPRSHCVHCRRPIAIYDNIPLLSYLWLRGRCRFCRTRISRRYPIIEGLMAGLSLVLYLQYGISIQYFAALYLTASLISLSYIDFDLGVIPDSISLSLLWVGLILSTQNVFVDSEQSIAGAVIGYLTFWGINRFYLWVRGRDGFGGGDLKLVAAIGAWLGAAQLYTVIMTASILGAVLGVLLILFRRSNSQSSLPFGPFLSVSAWFCQFVWT